MPGEWITIRIGPFTGRRLLIVEDELLIALELQSIVEQLGGTVVGPAGVGGGRTPAPVRHNAQCRPGDVSLREGDVTPVAQACRDRSVPFALVTGYGRLELEEPLLQSAPRVRKPFDSRAIHKVLAIMLNTDRENPDFRTDPVVAAPAGARRGTILCPARSDLEVTVSTSNWPRDQAAMRLCWRRSGQSPRPRSIDSASTRPASAAGSSSESTGRSEPRAAPILSAASMSIPITWPLGASRSWPWQASSTSQASCSWRLIKECSR